LLKDADDGSLPQQSLWVYRFYDQAATTFAAPPHQGIVCRLWGKLHPSVTAEGFDIEVRVPPKPPSIRPVSEPEGALVVRPRA
jgi:hypothetical protein